MLAMGSPLSCLLALRSLVHSTLCPLLAILVCHFTASLWVVIFLFCSSRFESLLSRLASLSAKMFCPAWSGGSHLFLAVLDSQRPMTVKAKSLLPAPSVQPGVDLQDRSIDQSIYHLSISSSPSLSLAGLRRNPPGPWTFGPCPRAM